MPAAYATAAAPVVVAPSAIRAQLFTRPAYGRGPRVRDPLAITTGFRPCRGGVERGRCISVTVVSTLKEQLRADLTAAMKARDELVKGTLRMTLTAIGNAEVAGAEARELDDAEVVKVITKEAKKRAESAEAFAAAGREELAAQERAEGEVLARYLPAQLSDEELAVIARTAVDDTAAELGEQPGPRQMGQVMRKASAATAGRADGGRVAAAVKALLVS
jgi:uncharacterized protein YqeY